MAIVVANIVNRTNNQQLYYTSNPFPYVDVYVYNLDTKQNTKIDYQEAVEKPVNGFIYVVFDNKKFVNKNSFNSSSVICAIIINNNILAYSQNGISWTNTNNDNIELRIQKEISTTDYTVEINTEQYVIKNNGNYGVIAWENTSNTFYKDGNLFKFTNGVWSIKLDEKSTSFAYGKYLSNYNAIDYVLFSEQKGVMTAIVYNGEIFYFYQDMLGMYEINTLPDSQQFIYSTYDNCNVYRVVDIISDTGEVSITNT